MQIISYWFSRSWSTNKCVISFYIILIIKKYIIYIIMKRSWKCVFRVCKCLIFFLIIFISILWSFILYILYIYIHQNIVYYKQALTVELSWIKPLTKNTVILYPNIVYNTYVYAKSQILRPFQKTAQNTFKRFVRAFSMKRGIYRAFSRMRTEPDVRTFIRGIFSAPSPFFLFFKQN